MGAENKDIDSNYNDQEIKSLSDRNITTEKKLDIMPKKKPLPKISKCFNFMLKLEISSFKI